jgi:hypothetical protein
MTAFLLDEERILAATRRRPTSMSTRFRASDAVVEQEAEPR